MLEYIHLVSFPPYPISLHHSRMFLIHSSAAFFVIFRTAMLLRKATAIGILSPALLLRESARAFTAASVNRRMSPSSSNSAAKAAAADPHLWLEDVLGEKQLSWVGEVNKRCIEYVGDPKETEVYSRIKSILDSKVRNWMGGRGM